MTIDTRFDASLASGEARALFAAASTRAPTRGFADARRSSPSVIVQ